MGLAKRPCLKELRSAELLETMTACTAAAPGAIVTLRRSLDRRQWFPYVSANFLDVYGFAPEDVRSDLSPIAERIYAVDRDRYQFAIAESARTLSPLHEEFRYEHPRKGLVWLELRANPVAEPDGGVLWRCYVQDVTERKCAEEKWCASEELFRALFDSNFIGVCYTRCVNGGAGLVVDANEKYLETIGRDREDLAAGRVDWNALTAPEFQHVNQAVIVEMEASGRTQRPIEKEYIRKDGTRAPVLVTCATIDKISRDGVGFVLDKTGQKQRKLHADRRTVMRDMTADINQPLTAALAYLSAARRMVEMKPPQHPTAVPQTLDEASAQIIRAAKTISRLKSFFARKEPRKFAYPPED